MNRDVTELLTSAIEFAFDDVAEVSRRSPTDNMPKEEQFRCAMFSFFKQRGYAVHAEASYPGEGKEECDLRVHTADSQELWIEIKRTWSGTGWITKPGEQIKKCEWDLMKLGRAPGNSFRSFVLFGIFDREPLETTLGKRLMELFPEHRIIDSGTRPFSWLQWGFSSIRGWAWRFPDSTNGREPAPVQ